MVGLKKNNGVVTTCQTRIIAVFILNYTQPMSHPECKDELFSCLKKLMQLEVIDLPITFQEVTKAVKYLALEKAPGIDGLPSEFYKCFWHVIGKDYFEMLLNSIQTWSLPKSCNRAVLSLLLKKVDLFSLKNWRPVALMCVWIKNVLPVDLIIIRVF